MLSVVDVNAILCVMRIARHHCDSMCLNLSLSHHLTILFVIIIYFNSCCCVPIKGDQSCETLQKEWVLVLHMMLK